MSNENYKSQILAKFGTAPHKHEIDGIDCHFKMLSAAEYEGYMFAKMESDSNEISRDNMIGFRAGLIALSMCDEDGKLLFEDAEEAGQALNNDFTEKAVGVIQAMHGGGKGAQEDIEKN